MSRLFSCLVWGWLVNWKRSANSCFNSRWRFLNTAGLKIMECIWNVFVDKRSFWKVICSKSKLDLRYVERNFGFDWNFLIIYLFETQNVKGTVFDISSKFKCPPSGCSIFSRCCVVVRWVQASDLWQTFRQWADIIQVILKVKSTQGVETLGTIGFVVDGMAHCFRPALDSDLILK